jgi:hypothetical protein
VKTTLSREPLPLCLLKTVLMTALLAVAAFMLAAVAAGTAVLANGWQSVHRPPEHPV